MSEKEELPSVLFLDDLAKLLRCSRRTVEQARADRRPLPPEMPSPDRRPRWSRQTVLAWMAQTDAATRFAASLRRRGGQR